jgi:hypothetical protein
MQAFFKSLHLNAILCGILFYLGESLLVIFRGEIIFCMISNLITHLKGFTDIVEVFKNLPAPGLVEQLWSNRPNSSK